MESLKICVRCKENLPRSQFYKDRCNKDGLNKYCKPCVKRYDQAKKGKHNPINHPIPVGLTHKICVECQQDLSISFFSRVKTNVDGLLHALCKNCYSQKQKPRHLKRTYNLTSDKVNSMLIEQEGKCVLCQRLFINTQMGKPYVDHDHKSGKVRALLCFTCNAALGMVNENPDTLFRMWEYLFRHKTKILNSIIITPPKLEILLGNIN